MGFERGVAVEVASKQEGFVGSYYEAKVIKQLQDGRYVVQYFNLVEDEDSQIPLREIVEEEELRLVPPKVPALEYFDMGEMVDAFARDGWWVGKVTGMSQGNYVVHFDAYPRKEYTYSAKRLRIHQDCINDDQKPLLQLLLLLQGGHPLFSSCLNEICTSSCL